VCLITRSHFYLSWSLLDALAESRHEVVPPDGASWRLALGVTSTSSPLPRTPSSITVSYPILVEARRMGLAVVKILNNVVSWVSMSSLRRGSLTRFRTMSNTMLSDRPI